MNPAALKKFIPALLLAFGLTLAFLPTALSGFQVLPSEDLDGNLAHYYFEHSWRWLKQGDWSKSPYAADYFYPDQYTLGNTDNGFGSVPIYWLFRLLGLNPGLAFVFWLGACEILNYLSMYWLLRRSLNLNTLSSAMGAFLFAFCAAKMYAMALPILIPEFYLIAGVMCVLKCTECDACSRKTKALYAVLAGILFSLQFYANNYLGWFFILAAGIYALLCLAFRSSREQLKSRFLAWLPWLFLGGCVFLTLLMPVFLNHAVMEERAWEETLVRIPDCKGLLRTFSFAYANLEIFLNNFLKITPFDFQLTASDYGLFSALGRRAFYFNFVNALGLGLITLVVALFGLFKAQSVWIRNLGFTALVIFALIFKYNDHTLWRFVWAYLPTAENIRGVCRIVYLLIPIFAVGFAVFINKLKAHKTAVFLCLILLLENAAFGYTAYNYGAIQEEVKKITQELDKYEADAPFLWTPENVQGFGFDQKFLETTKALWASVISRRPTINGISQNRLADIFPPYDDNNPESLFYWEATRKQDKPFIFLNDGNGEIISQVIEPLTSMQRLIYALKSSIRLFQPKSVLIILSGKTNFDAAELSKSYPDLQIKIMDDAAGKLIKPDECAFYDMIAASDGIKLQTSYLLVMKDASMSYYFKRLCFDFRKYSDFSPVKITGLSGVEPWGTWSIEKNVIFDFPTPLPQRFSAALTASAFKSCLGKDFKIGAGAENAEFKLGEAPMTVRVEIENPSREKSLKIIIPQLGRPVDYGINNDMRTLGILLQEVIFSTENDSAAAR